MGPPAAVIEKGHEQTGPRPAIEPDGYLSR